MAQPTNTYDTYDMVGQREGLTNILENISPTDVPFQSNIRRKKIKIRMFCLHRTVICVLATTHL